MRELICAHYCVSRTSFLIYLKTLYSFLAYFRQTCLCQGWGWGHGWSSRSSRTRSRVCIGWTRWEAYFFLQQIGSCKWNLLKTSCQYIQMSAEINLLKWICCRIGVSWPNREGSNVWLQAGLMCSCSLADHAIFTCCSYSSLFEALVGMDFGVVQKKKKYIYSRQLNGQETIGNYGNLLNQTPPGTPNRWTARVSSASGKWAKHVEEKWKISS